METRSSRLDSFGKAVTAQSVLSNLRSAFRVRSIGCAAALAVVIAWTCTVSPSTLNSGCRMPFMGLLTGPVAASYSCPKICTEGQHIPTDHWRSVPCSSQTSQRQWLGSADLGGLSQVEANEKYFRGRHYIAARDYHAGFPWGFRSDYNLGRQVGEGAFSSVFRAVHLPTNTTYAVKVLDTLDVSQAVREIDVSLRMRFHPNVITIYDAFVTEEGRTALVLKYLEDIVPREKVKQDMSPENLRRYLYTVLHVLDYAQKHGVLHRDLDVKNVFVDGKGNTIFVGDWGVSKFYFEEDAHCTDVGADGYRAPELLLKYPYYDYSADIWSAGAIFLEWLAGAEPVFKFGEDDMELTAIAEVLGSDGFHELLRSRRIYCPPETVLDIGYLKPNSLVSLVRRNNSRFITDDALDLLDKMLRWLPESRITVAESLEHPYFGNISDVVRAETDSKTGSEIDFTQRSPRR
jgi:casein kinase II subunit alpha